MFRLIITGLIALSLVSIVSCRSANKSGSDMTDVGGDPGSSISNQDIRFDPAGSDGGQIAGLMTVNFPYDKASLTASTKAQLKSNADWIKANTDVVIQVEGHSDARGSVEYNLALGERRAQSVKSYLQGLGVAAQNITVISYGEEKPLAEGDSEMVHSKNRRANFVPLPK